MLPPNQNMMMSMMPPQGGGGVGGMMMSMNQPRLPQAENTLYVGNLHPDIREDVLFAEFSRFGTLSGCRLLHNTYTGASREFAFVSFEKRADAERAIKELSGKPFYKRELRVYFKTNMRQVNPDANLIVKNLDKHITSKQLTEEVEKFGKTLSCFVRTHEVGGGRLESLGYGYVQFESVEGADKCLQELNGKELNGLQIHIEKFVPSKQRERAPVKNLYIKQFPAAWQKEQIERFIDEKVGAFGQVASKGVFKDEKINKFYAFVAFENEGEAKAAIDGLNERKVEGAAEDDEPLYAGVAQTKFSRKNFLQTRRLNVKNETNLYVRSLKPEVTQEQLTAAFEKFGKVTSVFLKSWNSPAQKDPSQVQSQGQSQNQGQVGMDSGASEAETDKSKEKRELKFGFVNFEKADDAKRALMECKREAAVRELVEVDPDTVNFVFFAQPRAVREQYLKMINRNLLATNAMRAMNMNHMSRMPYPFPYQNNNNNNRQQQQRPFRGPHQQNNAAFGGGMQMGMPPKAGGPRGQMPFNNLPLANMQLSGLPPLNMPFGNPNFRPPGFDGQQQQMMMNFGSSGMGTPGQMMTPQSNKDQTPGNVHPLFLNIQTRDFKTIANTIKTHRREFVGQDEDAKKQLLGTIMYQRVKQFNSDEKLVPKITGMLIDLDVLELDEILEIIESDENLQERIAEAIEVTNEIIGDN